MATAPAHPVLLPLPGSSGGGSDPFVDALLAPLLGKMRGASRQALTDSPVPPGSRCGRPRRDGLRACPPQLPDSDGGDGVLREAIASLGAGPVGAAAQRHGFRSGRAAVMERDAAAPGVADETDREGTPARKVVRALPPDPRGVDHPVGEATGSPAAAFASADAEVVRWRDAYEERAAIMQIAGGMTRAEADAAAYADILSLWRQEIPVGQEEDFLTLLVTGGADLSQAAPPAPAPHPILGSKP